MYTLNFYDLLVVQLLPLHHLTYATDSRDSILKFFKVKNLIIKLNGQNIIPSII